MSKYTVFWNVGATVIDTVEADSIDEALEKSDNYASLCHQCARNIDIGCGEDYCVETDGEVVEEYDFMSDLMKSKEDKVEELNAQLKALSNSTLGRIADLELALSEISALPAERLDEAGYIAVAALNKDKS